MVETGEEGVNVDVHSLFSELNCPECLCFCRVNSKRLISNVYLKY